MALAMWLRWLPHDDQIWKLLANNARRLWRDAAWPTATTYRALTDRGLVDDDIILTPAGLDWIRDEIEAARVRATEWDEFLAEGLAAGFIVKAMPVMKVAS